MELNDPGGDPNGSHHDKNYGPMSINGSAAVILLVMGISITVVTIIILLIIFKWCPKARISSSSVKAPVLQAINEPHLRMSRNELLAATANFGEENLIGRGGFSSVYKGILPNGRVVAVKWMKIDGENLPKKKFFAELKILGRLRHRNLLKILGYFTDSEEMALILEFMPNGSLENLLHGEDQLPLEWKQRLNIAMGVAQGLTYLHHESRTSVVHCDLKPSNVLLDEDFVPRIADFGVAKASNLHMTQSSCGPAWTIGYTAPERAYCLKPSSKSDVYSFGIMLLELITRERPTCSNFESGMTLIDWIRKAVAEDFVLDVIDPYLKTTPELYHEILATVDLALQCAQDSPLRRPTMREVIAKLAKIRGNHDQFDRFNVSMHRLLVSAPLRNTLIVPSHASFASFSTTN